MNKILVLEPRENGASKRRHILEGAKKESFDSDSSNGKEKQGNLLFHHFDDLISGQSMLAKGIVSSGTHSSHFVASKSV